MAGMLTISSFRSSRKKKQVILALKSNPTKAAADILTYALGVGTLNAVNQKVLMQKNMLK
jgi:hypothetical protein